MSHAKPAGQSALSPQLIRSQRWLTFSQTKGGSQPFILQPLAAHKPVAAPPVRTASSGPPLVLPQRGVPEIGSG
jgi:hypothetical protein